MSASVPVLPTHLTILLPSAAPTPHLQQFHPAAPSAPLSPKPATFCFWTDAWKAVRGHAEQTQVRVVEAHPPGDELLAALQRHRPATLGQYSSVHVFREGIRPCYDDDLNRFGGHYKLSHTAEHNVELVWVCVVQALAGGLFPGSATGGAAGGGVYGVTVFRKQRSTYSVKVWVGDSQDKAHLGAVREFLGRLLERAWYSSMRFCPHRFILQTLARQRGGAGHRLVDPAEEPVDYDPTPTPVVGISNLPVFPPGLSSAGPFAAPLLLQTLGRLPTALSPAHVGPGHQVSTQSGLPSDDNPSRKTSASTEVRSSGGSSGEVSLWSNASPEEMLMALQLDHAARRLRQRQQQHNSGWQEALPDTAAARPQEASASVCCGSSNGTGEEECSTLEGGSCSREMVAWKSASPLAAPEAAAQLFFKVMSSGN